MLCILSWVENQIKTTGNGLSIVKLKHQVNKISTIFVIIYVVTISKHKCKIDCTNYCIQFKILIVFEDLVSCFKL